MVKPLSTQRLEGDAEVVRRATHEAITELQGLPFVAARVIKSVTLVDGVNKLVPHGLGRAPQAVIVSVPRAESSLGGAVTEYTSGVDRSKYIGLRSVDFNVDVVVDVVVL